MQPQNPRQTVQDEVATAPTNETSQQDPAQALPAADQNMSAPSAAPAKSKRSLAKIAVFVSLTVFIPLIGGLGLIAGFILGLIALKHDPEHRNIAKRVIFWDAFAFILMIVLLILIGLVLGSFGPE